MDIEDITYIRFDRDTEESNKRLIWIIVLVLLALFTTLLWLTKTREYVFNLRRH